jgi:hypothetical protein
MGRRRQGPTGPLPFSRPPRFGPKWQPSHPSHAPLAHAPRGGYAAAASPPTGLTRQPSPNPLSLSPPLYPPLAQNPSLPHAAPLPAPGSPAAAAHRPPVVSPGPLPFFLPPCPFFPFPSARGIPTRRSPGPASWRSAARPWRLGPTARSAPASPALGARPSSSSPRLGAALRPPCPPAVRLGQRLAMARQRASARSPWRGPWHARPRPRRSSAVAPGAAPGVLRRPALAAGAWSWPRRGFGAVRSLARLGVLLARLVRGNARRGLLAWLACDVAAWRAPWRPSSLTTARAACSWRPARRVAARPRRVRSNTSLVCAAAVRCLVRSLA